MPKGMDPFDAQDGGEALTIGIQAWAWLLWTAEQGREQYIRLLFPNAIKGFPQCLQLYLDSGFSSEYGTI